MKTNNLLDFYKEGLIEAGCDEAGRGCLAGPVFAAAVILPTNFNHPLLNDSKQVNEKNRNTLRLVIEETAIAFSVALCTNEEIDKINILNASFLAMHRAISKLDTVPQHLIIDGNRFKPYPNITHACIIKGDGKYKSIAAASILAKTYRDEFMLNEHTKYKNYKWNKNKGYPTLEHRQAIQQHGLCYLHRRTFNSGYPQLTINF